jgi:hypothetical protein
MKIEAARISKIESVNARPPLTQPNPDAQPANITQPQIDFYKEKLMNNPESMAVVEDMANNTQIQELVNDPDTQEALKSGNVQALMQNEKFMNLTNDPEVQRNIKKLQQGMSN